MKQQPTLVRGLSLLDAFSLVAGSMIGTGIFMKAAPMSQVAGSPFWALMAWVVAGLLSLAGALVYAEIGGLFPHAGGEYVYLREAYGRFPAYLYGWTRVMVAGPATIAAYAVGSASFLAAALNLEAFGGIVGVSITFIAFFTLLNCLAITVGGKVQSAMTVLKVLLITGLGLGLLLSGKGDWSNFSQASEVTSGSWPGFSAFGTAMIAALWAYDGWNNLPMIAGEVKNPKRNVPWSLILGVFSVLLIYGLINIAFYYVLPFSEVLTGNSNDYPEALSVGSKAAQAWLGTSGGALLSVMFVIFALGAMNGSMMTGARVPYAMASDGLFFKPLSKLHQVTRVPVIAILVQGVLSCVMALSGNFDQLTDYVVFASWIFYGLIMSSIFIFRKRLGQSHDGYKVWGFPIMPLIFMASAAFLLLNTLITSPRNALIGLGMISLGVPFFFLFNKSSRSHHENSQA